MRVTAEPGYLIHSTPYRESSLLVDIFTQRYGRLRCVAKGVRKAGKKGGGGRPPLFVEHNFSWTGRGELKTLTAAESRGAACFLQGEPLFKGLYINELFYHLLHEHDPHPQLYQNYHWLIQQLIERDIDEIDLRMMEMVLLDQLGYGLALHSEALSGEMLKAQNWYCYQPDQGVVEAGSGHTARYSGAQLTAIAKRDFTALEVRRAAKQLLRQVIDFYLGGRTLHSRRLYRQFLNRGEGE